MSETTDEATPEPSTGQDVAEVADAAAAQPPASVAVAVPSQRRARRVRWLRGGLPLLLGGFVQFFISSMDAHFRWSVPIGFIATAAAAWGLLDLLGSFDDADVTAAKRIRIHDLLPSLAALAGTLLITLSLVGFAVAGRLPVIVSAILIPAAFIGLVASVYRVGERLGVWAADEAGEARSLVERHGFWVIVLGTLLYLPMLGSYSLSDPWETHYGEVAREILARDDWISTWWAQDGWFWSKPVLNFWTEALSMSLFGAGYQPDQMLAAAGQGRVPWPEWAIRMPVFIFTIVALYLLYKGVAKVFGRRAGLLGAIVLATMPHWFFLAHQTMTDMPFVAAMTSAMGLLLLGIHTDSEQRLRVYELDLGVTQFRVSGYHLVFLAILMAVIPQVLYLVSRNIEFQLIASPHGFRPHADVFFSGSGGGNCGLPGNQDCVRSLPANRDFQPWLQALLWAGTTGLLLWINRRERRLSRMYFLAAWFFAAISTMGKGPAGFLLPMMCAGAYIFATASWKKMTQLEFISGLLIILSVAIPWYFAMYMRHGQAFTDRLLFHDMYKRAMVHVHDTNVGVDVSFRYFVWQLGYAFFPWTGLVPAGLVWWARRRDDAHGGRGDVSVFLVMWFVFAFALFTAMLTKFHHYIFPAVPPAAMLTGIMLDRMIGERPLARVGSLVSYLAAIGGGAMMLLYGFFRLFPGMLMGFKAVDGDPRPGMMWLGIPLIVLGAAILIAGVWRFGTRDDEPEDANPGRRSFESVLLGAAGIIAAVVVALTGRDLVIDLPGGTTGQAQLLYLFTYNYKRVWPESLDFSGMIAAFALVASGAMLLLMVRRYRHHIVALVLAVGVLWAAWALDIYMVKTAPHWGQRETILAYYQVRESPEHQLVAYQMNWKGENFYAGNRIPAFVSSGAKFKTWIEEERKKGKGVFYFVTEHGRSKSLQNELGSDVKAFDKITDVRLNNKFALFKASF